MKLTIARKELKVLFSSPLAWVILALVQLVLGWIFLTNLDIFLQIQPELIRLLNPPGVTEAIVVPLFAMAAVVLLMVTPLLTARLIAEERRNHTLPLLISAPASMADIVLGKFFGLMIFIAALIALVIGLALCLLAGGPLDLGLLLSNIAGLLLLAACYVALGLYISCLSAQPATAAAGTLGLLLGSWVLDSAQLSEGSVVRGLSLLAHFENFNHGMIDTFDVVYLILFTLFFLGLSIQRLNSEQLGITA